MKRAYLSAHIGLLFVGVSATAALLLEARLPVTQDVHFLLQLLWMAVAMGSVFVVMLQPALNPAARNDDCVPAVETEQIAEWQDPDRLWMQQHPDEGYLASDIDREEV
ncbi:MAG: hypothetical protein U0694_16270 [Anaerolineae bacterium]